MNKEAKKFVKGFLKGLIEVEVFNNSDDTVSESFYVKNDVVLFKTGYMFSGKQSNFKITVSSNLIWDVLATKYNLKYSEIVELILNSTKETKLTKLSNQIKSFFGLKTSLTFNNLSLCFPMDDEFVNKQYRFQIGLIKYPTYKGVSSSLMIQIYEKSKILR